MCVLNDIDRFHLVDDVIDRVPQLAQRAAYAKQEIRDKLIEHKEYIRRPARTCRRSRIGLGGEGHARQGASRPGRQRLSHGLSDHGRRQGDRVRPPEGPAKCHNIRSANRCRKKATAVRKGRRPAARF